jgi:hypothetical protein
VPQIWQDAEAPSTSTVPGVGYDGHWQFLVDAWHLQPLVGRQIVGLMFRRDASWSEILSSGTGEIVVRAGHAAHGSSSARADLGSNLPGAQEVFRGSVAVPGAPAVAGYVGWGAPHGLTIPFTNPLVYSGGPLGFEVEGGSIGGPFWWPVDGVEELVAGSVQELGAACGAVAAGLGRTALVPERSLVVGGTVPFTFLGEAGVPAQLLLGFDTLVSPIDLGPIGAAGCELRVAALASIPAVVRNVGPAGIPGIAELRLQLPADSGLFAAEFVAQWLQLGSPLTTSETLRCRVAGTAPSLGMATVIRSADGSVEVQPTQAPVLGLLWQ